MRKIYIDKNDTVAAIIEKVLSTPDNTVILYVPRFAKLVETANNFRLLKREIDASDKEVEIESVDDEVLEMAKSVGIPAKNPFFQKNRRSFSDIVSPAGGTKSHKHHDGKVHKVKTEEVASTDDEIVSPITRDIEMEEEDVVEIVEGKKKPIHSKISRIKSTINFKVGKRLEEGFFGRSPWKVAVGAAAVVVVIIASMAMLASAKITVTLDKISDNFDGTLYVSTAVREPHYISGQARVPGVILEKTKNITGSYPATGTEQVTRKASGTITIYNAYSTARQPLVRETRFVSPDGKIFRIQQNITVPGATIVAGKLVPSKLDVVVYADKAGADYNIAPTRFRIPGFQGSPKYEGFYAESTAPMTGGFVGMAKVATNLDILKAKEQNKKNLEGVLQTEMLLSVPKEIETLEGANSFTVTKEDVSPVANESGNFTVTTAGTIRLFGFKESDMLEALKQSIPVDVPAKDLVLNEGTPVYSNARADFGAKVMQASLKLQGVWTRAFDADKFKVMALGKSAEEINANLDEFQGIKSVSINLWPFWVGSVPTNPKKVSIDVN